MTFENYYYIIRVSKQERMKNDVALSGKEGKAGKWKH
jgi:hypothetical protein